MVVFKILSSLFANISAGPHKRTAMICMTQATATLWEI